MTEANFLYWVLSDVLIFIKLCSFLLFESVHIEMLIVNDNLLVEIVNLFLLLLGQFFDHVVARDKDSLEIVWVREGVANYLYFGFEVSFAVVPRHVLETLKLLFGFGSLFVVRNRQLVHREIVGSLRMLIPILSLHDVVETGFGLPSCLVVLFLFEGYFVFVDDWECQTEVLCRVSVEFCLVLCDRLSEMLLLMLPDVEFLATVWVHLETFWDVPLLAKRPSGVHGMNHVDVLHFEIVRYFIRSHLN